MFMDSTVKSLAYCLLLLGHTSAYSLIISCSQLTRNNQRVIIFGDLHFSEPSGERTLKQRQDLVDWLKALNNSKLVIVEDKVSQLYEEERKNIGCVFTEEIITPTFTKISAQGSCQISPLCLFASTCDFYGIPVINCEWRDTPGFVEKYTEALKSYNDGPILNAWYNHIIKDKEADEQQSNLIEAYTAHAINTATSQDIIVLMGDYHRQTLVRVLQTAGYTLLQEITPQVSSDQFIDQHFSQKYDDYVTQHAWSISHRCRNWFDPNYPRAIGRKLGIIMAQEYAMLYALDCSFVVNYWLQE